MMVEIDGGCWDSNSNRDDGQKTWKQHRPGGKGERRLDREFFWEGADGGTGKCPATSWEGADGGRAKCPVMSWEGACHTRSDEIENGDGHPRLTHSVFTIETSMTPQRIRRRHSSFCLCSSEHQGRRNESVRSLVVLGR